MNLVNLLRILHLLFHLLSIFVSIYHDLCDMSMFISVAKRKSLFDDKPVEIQELTYIIKQDISTLNKQIAKLQEVSRRNFLLIFICCWTNGCFHIFVNWNVFLWSWLIIFLYNFSWLELSYLKMVGTNRHIQIQWS